MTQNKRNIILHCNCTTEDCKFYNLKEQESEIGEEFCWSKSKNQKLGMVQSNLLVWRRKSQKLDMNMLGFIFLPKKKKCTQVSILGIQGDEGSWVIIPARVARNYESFLWNPRRWGGPRDHGSSICNGGKKLWKFCLESKEMRRSKGSWFIILAMVGRNYERP